MPKRSLVFNPQTDEALKRLAAKTDTPVAVLIRKAVEQYLAQHGEKVDASVSWGGQRQGKAEDRA